MTELSSPPKTTDAFFLQVVRAIPGSNSKKDPDNQWGKSGFLEFPCERCGKRMAWGRVAFNGHVRVACETPNCYQLLS